MKKQLLHTVALLLCSVSVAFSQYEDNLRMVTGPLNKTVNHAIDLNNSSRSMTCQDTLSYPFYKEVLLGTPTYYTLETSRVNNDAVSQMFYATTPGVQVKGAEVYVANSANGVATAVVRAQVFSVNASNNPIGVALASGTVTVSSTTGGFYYINFPTPITVTSNYAIVVDVTNTGGVFNMYFNDIAVGQSYDEDLSRFRSSLAAFGSNGNWIPFTSVTGYTQTLDFEPLVGPIVSYNIATTGTVTPTTACLGQPVIMNNTTSSPYLSNRMYNMNVFETYFNLSANDSTYVWAPDGTDLTNLIWTKNTSYTYPASGNFNAVAYTLGGFGRTCLDNTLFTVTINPVADAAFNYANPTLCSGGANVTPATVATPGGTFSSTSGLVFANATTGEINISASSVGTYVITYNTGGTCPATSTQSITITSAPDASFTYAASTYCMNETNPSPVITGSVGTFSSTTGLSINASTGVINLTASTPGTYTVTNTINTAGCPLATDQHQVTIVAVDDAAFTYASATLCLGGANVSPSTIATAGGTFSSTAGLVFANASTGEINLGASTAGTYTITYTTAGTCPSSSTLSVTLTSTPDASFSYNSAFYCKDATNPTPTITGAAGSFTSTTGLSINGSTGVINLATSTAGTYTVTNTIAASGSCPAAIETAQITIADLPDATVLSTFGATLTAQATGVTYQWYDCATNTAVAGATSQTFTATAPGSYKVVINDGNCSATSTCFAVSDAGVTSNSIDLLSVYPNPTENNVVIEGLTSTNSIVSVVDLNGKVLTELTTSSSNLEISFSNFANGIYLIKIQSDTINGIMKVVKK